MGNLQKIIQDIENLPKEINKIVINDIGLARDMLEAKSLNKSNCVMGFKVTYPNYPDGEPQQVREFYTMLKEKGWAAKRTEQRPISALLAQHLTDSIYGVLPKNIKYNLGGMDGLFDKPKEVSPVEFSIDWINSGIERILQHRNYDLK